MLILDHVNKTYGAGETAVKAVNDICLTIETGSFAVITGQSGSGKSTLLNILGLLDRFDSGSYSIDGEQAGQLRERQLAHLRLTKIGFVHQFFHLLPDETALGNVALPLGYLGVGKRERERRSMEALEKVGLGQRAHHLPAALSGGEQQRVAIARAIVTNPSMLLADEPTGNLDSKVSLSIQQLFRDLNRSGLTVVIVTHDDRIVRPGDMHIVVQDGVATVH